MSNITLSALTLANSNKYPTTTGAIKLRIWYTGCAGSSFQDSLGNIVMLGSGDSNFFIEVPVVLAGTVLSIPSYVLPSTDDSSCLSAKATGQFYVNGAAREVLFSQYIITATLGASISFSQLFNYQPGAISGPTNPLYLTAPEVSALILASIGTLNDASVTVKGRTKLSTAPLSATNPIAVGNQDPLILALRGGSLESTGSIVIGADTDASGTDGISLQVRSVTKWLLNNNGTITCTSTKLTLGDSTIAAGARIDLTTHPVSTATTGRLWSLFSQSFTFSNGPGGESNYDNDTLQFGAYNTGNSGNKIVAGLVNFGWVNEARFYFGGFQSEHYFQWLSPSGLISIRPFAFDVDHADGNTLFSLQGEMNWIRNIGTGGGQWAILNHNDDGGIQLNIRPASYISFANNNSTALLFSNAAGTNSIPLGYANSSDEVVLAPGGQRTLIPGTANIADLEAGFFRISGDTDTYMSSVFSGYLQLVSNGTEKFRIQPQFASFNTHLIWDGVDSTYDLGLFNATNQRPRDIAAGRNVIIDGVYKVGANQVVGPRETGWTIGSGTPNKGAFAAYAGQTASVGYVQAEAQATDNAAKAASQRLLAVEQALRTHGLFN